MHTPLRSRCSRCALSRVRIVTLFAVLVALASPRAAHAQWGYPYSAGRVAVAETDNRSFARSLRIGAGVSAVLSPASSLTVSGRVIFDLAPVAELLLFYQHPVFVFDGAGRGNLIGEVGLFLHSNDAQRVLTNYTLQQNTYSTGYYTVTDRTSVNAPMTTRVAWGGRLGGLFLWGTHEEKPDGAAASMRYAPMRAGGYAGVAYARYFNSTSYVAGFGQRGTTGFFRVFLDGVFTPVVEQGPDAPVGAPLWGYGARGGVEGSVGRSLEAGYRLEGGWNRIGGWYLLASVHLEALFTFDR